MVKIVEFKELSELSLDHLFRGINTFTSFITGEKGYLFLDDHLQRLFAGGHFLFPNVYQAKNSYKFSFFEILKGFLTKRFIPNSYYRLTLFPEEICIYQRPNIVSNSEIKVNLAKNIRPVSTFPSFLKYPNYLFGWCEKNQLLANISPENTEVLFLDHLGHLTETSTSNIFLLQSENEIVTPLTSSQVLDGILRKNLIKFLKASGVRVFEKDLSENDLFLAKEVFLTNCVQGVRQVSYYNNQRISSSTEFYSKLTDQFGRFGESV